jgi:hypothetical protein
LEIVLTNPRGLSRSWGAMISTNDEAIPEVFTTDPPVSVLKRLTVRALEPHEYERAGALLDRQHDLGDVPRGRQLLQVVEYRILRRHLLQGLPLDPLRPNPRLQAPAHRLLQTRRRANHRPEALRHHQPPEHHRHRRREENHRDTEGTEGKGTFDMLKKGHRLVNRTAGPQARSSLCPLCLGGSGSPTSTASFRLRPAPHQSLSFRTPGCAMPACAKTKPAPKTTTSTVTSRPCVSA